MLTKADLVKMKEEQLCKQVLVPLLRAMKFNDVMFYHGGEGEKGKDIVCWKEDEVKARVNYALVVKSQKIMGQAKAAKGTAGEVATQIQQVFGSPFIAPVTAEMLNIHICWVVTNKEITKQGMDAIKAIIKPSNYERHVSFIDGDTLWELVEKYLGKHVVWGKMEEIQSVLKDFDTHYQPEIHLNGKQINVEVKEKFEGASQEKPLDFNFSFEFPNTPVGKAKFDELKNAYTTGAGFSIPPNYIKSVEIPDLLKPIFDFDVKNTALIAEPLPSNHHFIASIEFSNVDGDVISFDYVDFQLMQSGTEESTLENVEKGSLLKIKLVTNFPKRTLKLTFNWKLEKASYNCSQLLRFCELQNCLSKPFILKVVSKEHNIVLFTQQSDQGIGSSPPKFYFDALRALSVLQQKSNKIVMVPLRVFDDEEIKELRNLISIVNSGVVKGRWKNFSLTLKDLSQEGFDALSDRLYFFRLDGNEVLNIFDVELPLGITESVFRNALISNLDDIRKAYSSGVRDIELQIVAQNGEAGFEKTYRDFVERT